MGRLIFAIVAVAAVQIAFSVYMSYQSTADPTKAAVITNVPQRNAASNAANGPNISEEPAPVTANNDIDISPVEADKVGLIESRRSAEVLAQRAEPRERRSPAAAALRPSFIGYRENADRASIERQYFGRMVVERRFWPAKSRANDSSAYVRRQVFGRMVVERTFGIAMSQSAGRTKAKKRRYVAKSPALQQTPNLIRG